MTASGDGPPHQTIEGAVARFTLDRPATKNVLDAGAIAALHQALDFVELQRQVRVLVLHHTGTWFCSGMDLSDTRDADGDTDRFFSVLQRLSDTDVVTIAAVAGRAAGGGVGLAAACDVVLASSKAEFTLPEALWGLLPAAVYPFLRRRVGPHAARHLALTTRTLTAAQAADMGLVDEVTDLLHQATVRTARRGCCVSREATRRIKDYTRLYDPLPSGAGEAARDALAEALNAPGVRDGIDRWTRTGLLPWE